MFWQQATKATTVNSPCLTYFFLNFSWFNKQLGNEKHIYGTSMYSETLLLWRIIGIFRYYLINVAASKDHPWAEKLKSFFKIAYVYSKRGACKYRSSSITLQKNPWHTWHTYSSVYTNLFIEIKGVLTYQNHLCFCETNINRFKSMKWSNNNNFNFQKFT